MVERIGDDGVLGAQKGLEQTRVRVEATGKQDGVLHPQEFAQTCFEPLVRKLGAADEPNRRHAEAVLGQRIPCGFDQTGVIGEPQVVVGAQIDAGGPGLKRHLALLGRGDDLLLLEQAVGLQGIDPGGEIADERTCHVTRPQRPYTRPGSQSATSGMQVVSRSVGIQANRIIISVGVSMELTEVFPIRAPR